MAKFRSEDLIQQLRQRPRISSAELCARFGIQRSTLARALKTLGPSLLSAGATRSLRYAMRRPLRGVGMPYPVYRIDEEGRGREAGVLSLVDPHGSLLSLPADFPWPLDKETADGWFDGLPYSIADMRPQGFLGRNFALAYARDLGVSERPTEWSDDDIVHVLTTMGMNQPGDLIVGEVAYRRFLDYRLTGEGRFIPDDHVERVYLERAAEAASRGVPGSSAGGEFPKFTSSRIVGDRKFDVIVKFSGADGSPAVQRWADMLTCEHLATEVLRRGTNIEVSESTLRHSGGRTFLEVTRFDRHGAFGRSPVCTLECINGDLLGLSEAPWPRYAQRMLEHGWIARQVFDQISIIWLYGRLIGNNDMHLGNLAFRPGLTLAPVYDMLPAMYGPLPGGEVPSRAFAPELPLPSEAQSWIVAAGQAIEFWDTCAADTRISDEFRRLCAANGQSVRKALSIVDSGTTRHI